MAFPQLNKQKSRKTLPFSRRLPPRAGKGQETAGRPPRKTHSSTKTGTKNPQITLLGLLSGAFRLMGPSTRWDLSLEGTFSKINLVPRFSTNHRSLNPSAILWIQTPSSGSKLHSLGPKNLNTDSISLKNIRKESPFPAKPQVSSAEIKTMSKFEAETSTKIGVPQQNRRSRYRKSNSCRGLKPERRHRFDFAEKRRHKLRFTAETSTKIGVPQQNHRWL